MAVSHGENEIRLETKPLGAVAETFRLLPPPAASPATRFESPLGDTRHTILLFWWVGACSNAPITQSLHRHEGCLVKLHHEHFPCKINHLFVQMTGCIATSFL